jgi:hypothetical protein
MGSCQAHGNKLPYPRIFSFERPADLHYGTGDGGKLMITLRAMKKRFRLVLLATATCGGLAVSPIHSKAHGQVAAKSCNSECLLKEIDMLDKKVDALERTVDALSIETNKSIKSGQKIILHTDPGLSGGGCLTYIGPSGDLGGFVSWNVNCSHGTSWMIK